MPTPRLPQTVAPTPDVPSVIASLGSPRPSPHAIQAAEALLQPVGPQGRVQIGWLLLAVRSPFPPAEVDPEASEIADRWLVDAMTERPMWAISAGCRAVTLASRFRPTPAEILAAIDVEVDRLAAPLAQRKGKAILAAYEASKRPAPQEPTADAKARVAALLNDVRRKVGP